MNANACAQSWVTFGLWVYGDARAEELVTLALSLGVTSFFCSVLGGNQAGAGKPPSPPVRPCSAACPCAFDGRQALRVWPLPVCTFPPPSNSTPLASRPSLQPHPMPSKPLPIQPRSPVAGKAFAKITAAQRAKLFLIGVA